MIDNTERHYKGHYFCPHKGMTLGFSISILLVVVTLMVTLVVCLKIKKVRCKQRIQEQANASPNAVITLASADLAGQIVEVQFDEQK